MMIIQIILCLILTTRYDSMENPGFRGDTDDELALVTLDDHNLQQSALNDSQHDKSSSAFAQESDGAYHAHHSVFLKLYSELTSILSAWEPYVNDLDAQDVILLTDVKGNLLKYQRGSLCQMEKYMKEYKDAAHIDDKKFCQLKMLGQTIKVIKEFTAIAMHLSSPPFESGRIDIVTQMDNKESSEITRQLQLIVLFGKEIVLLNLAINNLKKIGYYFDSMANRLQSELDTNTKSTVASETEADSNDKKDAYNTDISFLQKVVVSIKDIAETREIKCNDLLDEIANGVIPDSETQEFLQYMRHTAELVNEIQGSAENLSFGVYDNPHYWHDYQKQMDYLVNLVDGLSAKREFLKPTDGNGRLYDLLLRQYTDQGWVAIAQSLMLQRLAQIFPELTFEKSFFDEKTQSLYACHGLKIGSNVREIAESNCTIIGDTGKRYDIHSFTVKCKWAAVKSALAHLTGLKSNVFVIQIYNEKDTKIIVFSGILTPCGLKDQITHTIGVLADHLPNNESMNQLLNGGAQILFSIKDLEEERVKKTLKIITGHIKKAKSSFFLYTLKEEQGFADLFEKGKIRIRMDGIHIPSPGGILEFRKPGDLIDRSTKTGQDESAILFEHMLGKEREIIKLETETFVSLRFICHSTIFQVKGTSIMTCLQPTIEQQNPKTTQHLWYLRIGILLDIESINDQFLRALDEIGERECNLYIMHDEDRNATHIALLITGCYLNTDTNKVVIHTGFANKEMMQKLVDRYKEHQFSLSGHEFKEENYVFETKAKHIVKILKQLRSDRKFLPDCGYLKRLR